jgi:YegS/Rv2252/BmrU family lipid kinase
VSRRLALLVNPAAAGGKARAAVAPAQAELERLGADFHVIETSSGEHAKTVARGLAEAGETAVAVGGDGLVGTLAGALCGSEGSLAMIPSGRGNDFARVLGIPTDPAAAARVAYEGEELLVDVGQVDGKSFVGIASFGFDSVANRVANEAKLVRGNLVYLYAGLRTLATWKPARFEVVVDGVPHSIVGYGVAVANSKAYGGGMYLVPHAELDDGRLDVMLTAEHSKLRFLRGTFKVFKGAHVTDPALTFLKGEVVEVRADRPFMIYADGDPLAEVPATIRVVRQALRVVVPRG